MTDEELIARIRRRETAALSALMDRYVPVVYALVARILQGSSAGPDVEECVSDTFHAAWARVGQYDPQRAPLKTWLLILAKYQALERRRTLSNRSETPVPELSDEDWGPSPEQELARREERQEVQQALAQLAPTDRELVYRRYFIGERVDRVAAELGLTRQAADNRLWRARTRLRQLLSWGREAARDDA